MELTITNNTERSRFETTIEENTAYVQYIKNPTELKIIKTLVPQEIGGKGIAAALTKYALEYAKENELRVIPLCSYATIYIEKHPEYKELTFPKE